MIKSSLIASVLLGTSLSASSIDLQPNRDSLWKAQYGDRPAHWLTKEESLKKQLAPAKVLSGERPVPSSPRACAEFEPVEAVIVSYPGQFGFSLNTIKELTDVVKVYVVANSSQQSSVLSQIQSSGANMDSVEILNSSSDSYWTRDYGPWCIAEGDEKISIVDFDYNRPRPNDDNIPQLVGNTLSMDVYKMSMEHCGGNYMTDGGGNGASTDLVVDENPGLGESGVKSAFSTYLGIDNYHITIDPLGDYIKHIDCWGKFLAPDKILIGQVNGSQSDEYDEVADYFANATSPFGTPYKVYRVFTAGEPYTNSTIVNGKVLVPIMNSSNDAAALEVYREAMPGYDVVGVLNTSNNNWMSTDALHCRTKGVTERDLLYINHTPLKDTVTAEDGKITLSFELIAYSGDGIDIANSSLSYTRGDMEAIYNAPIKHLSGNSYEVTLDASSVQYEDISYYLSVKDNGGKVENFPLMGASDEIDFTIFNPSVSVSQLSLGTKLNPVTFSFNNNSLVIDATFDGTIAISDIHGREVLSEQISSEKSVLMHNLSTGVYLYQFKSKIGDYLSSGKINF